MSLKLLTVIASIFLFTNLTATELSNQELLNLIKEQQTQIEKLQKMVLANQKKVAQADDKIETTVEVVEMNLSQDKQQKTHLGSYGELHYNKIEDNKQIDFHRFVLFLGHDFTDNIRMFSELEVEHSLAGDGKPGEVELEQAYVEMDLSERSAIKAGLFLLPVGILNETHEPNTFYGVERNPVEKNIIPSTWWEAGAALHSNFADGWSADFAIHSGLETPTSGNKSFLIRSGRQKVAKANADSLAYTLRMKYTAIPGLEVAASYQRQDDITQGVMGMGASLFSAHTRYQKGKFGLKALYAMWDIEGSEAKAIGRNEQKGYYFEPTFRFSDDWGIFARYNEWDNNAGNNLDTKMRQTNIGINYWPHHNVVFKLDIENRSGAQQGNGFNLGVGYSF